jgi:hypothetical protein
MKVQKKNLRKWMLGVSIAALVSTLVVAATALRVPDSKIHHIIEKIRFAGYGFITLPILNEKEVNISYRHGTPVSVVLRWGEWNTTTTFLQLIEINTAGFGLLNVSPPLPVSFITGTVPPSLAIHISTPSVPYDGDFEFTLVFNITY